MRLDFDPRPGLALVLALGLTGAAGPIRAQEDDLDKPLATECVAADGATRPAEPPVLDLDQWFDTSNPELGFAPLPLDPYAEEKTAGETCNIPEARVDPDPPYDKTDDAGKLAAPCAIPMTLTMVAGVRDHYAQPQDPANLTAGIRTATGVAGPWAGFDQPGPNFHFGHAFQPSFTPLWGYQFGSLTVRLRPFDDIPENDTLSLWSTNPLRRGWGVKLTNITPMRPGREVTLRFDLRTLGTGGGSNLLADINQFRDLNVYVQDDSAIDQMELTLSCSDPASTGLVGVIPGPAGCGALPSYEIYLDNEDKRNANNRGGWIGATVSNKNTLFKVCAVDGYRFTNAAEAGANFAVLALSSTCPAGFTRFDRFHDNEDNRPASYDTLPGGSPTTTVQPEQNTNMAFCVATGRNTSVPSSVFPDLGGSYGVFGAKSGAAWALERGYVFLDDEDNRNRNTPSTGPAYTTEFVGLGKNTTYYLARVK